jgi:alkylhydroperoxidase family enzyme
MVYNFFVGDFEALFRALEESVLGGEAHTPAELRESAAAHGDLPVELRALVEKIHRHAYRITDEEMAALSGRYTDDQLFEIVVAAAFGAGRERLRIALQALEEA